MENHADKSAFDKKNDAGIIKFLWREVQHMPISSGNKITFLPWIERGISMNFTAISRRFEHLDVCNRNIVVLVPTTRYSIFILNETLWVVFFHTFPFPTKISALYIFL